MIKASGKIVGVQKNVVIGSLDEYRTKRLAERALKRLLFGVNDPGYRMGRVATVEEFSENWKAAILERRKPSARQSAESHLRKHTAPRLSRVRLDNPGVGNQQAFVNHLSTQKISCASIEGILATVSSMLKSAKNWSYICEPLDLERLVVPPRGIQKPARSFTPEQAQDIIQLAENPYKLMFAIAAYTGIRAGEIMGLRTEDDLDREILTVRQSSWQGQLQAPKSAASENSVPLPAPLLEMLKKHDRKAGLIFLNAYKRPFNQQKMVQKKLCPLGDALKIPRAGFHALRNMHTTPLLDTGTTPEVTQRQLRHADARVTLNVYAHLGEDAHREVVERTAEKFFRGCSTVNGNNN